MFLTREDVLSALVPVEVATKEILDGSKISMFYVPEEAKFEVVIFVPSTNADGSIGHKGRVISSGSAFKIDDLLELYNNLK